MLVAGAVATSEGHQHVVEGVAGAVATSEAAVDWYVGGAAVAGPRAGIYTWAFICTMSLPPVQPRSRGGGCSWGCS